MVHKLTWVPCDALPKGLDVRMPLCSSSVCYDSSMQHHRKIEPRAFPSSNRDCGDKYLFSQEQENSPGSQNSCREVREWEGNWKAAYSWQTPLKHLSGAENAQLPLPSTGTRQDCYGPRCFQQKKPAEHRTPCPALVGYHAPPKPPSLSPLPQVFPLQHSPSIPSTLQATILEAFQQQIQIIFLPFFFFLASQSWGKKQKDQKGPTVTPKTIKTADESSLHVSSVSWVCPLLSKKRDIPSANCHRLEVRCDFTR